MSKYTISIAFLAFTAMSANAYTSVPALNSRAASMLAPIDETLDELMKHYLKEKKTTSDSIRSKQGGSPRKNKFAVPKMKKSVAHGKGGVFNPVLKTAAVVNTRTRSRNFGSAYTTTNGPAVTSSETVAVAPVEETLDQLMQRYLNGGKTVPESYISESEAVKMNKTVPKLKETFANGKTCMSSPLLKTARVVNTRTRSRSFGGESKFTNKPATTPKAALIPKVSSLHVPVNESLDELMQSYLTDRKVVANGIRSKRVAPKKGKSTVPKMRKRVAHGKGSVFTPAMETYKAVAATTPRNFGDAYIFVEEPAYTPSSTTAMRAPTDKQLDVLVQHYLNEQKMVQKSVLSKPVTAIKKKAAAVPKMTKGVAHGNGGVFTPVLKSSKTAASPSGSFGGAYTTSSTQQVQTPLIGSLSKK